MATIIDAYPVLGLRIIAGDLELRGIDDEAIAELIELAQRGVHPAELMPFSHPWTDTPPERFAISFAQYHWGTRASFSPDAWALDLVVRWRGEVVGTQGFRTHHYLVTKTGETGSWLGREFQGRGIGTRMRQAMCAFLFDDLDVEQITSAAFMDNPASLAVSRKVGYQPNGIRRMERRPGEWQYNQALLLTPETFVRGTAITVEGLTPFRRLVGLDA